jgi:hypothetical protein
MIAPISPPMLPALVVVVFLVLWFLRANDWV